MGGKLGIDATGAEVLDRVQERLSDDNLLAKMQEIDSNILALKQYMLDTANPICVIAVDKKESQKALIDKLMPLSRYLAILVIVDNKNNDLSNPYMLVWRVVNNIDAQRDIILEPFIAIDATNKNRLDGYSRVWPDDTICDLDILNSLADRGLIEKDEDSWIKFGVIEFNRYKS